MIPLLSGASDENNMTGKTREKWERNMHGTLHNCENPKVPEATVLGILGTMSESSRSYCIRHLRPTNVIASDIITIGRLR